MTTVSIQEAAKIKNCAPTTIYYRIHLSSDNKNYLHSVKIYGQYVMNLADVKRLQIIQIKPKTKEKTNAATRVK